MDTSWAHCAWATGEDLSGPHVHRLSHPCSTPHPGTRHEDLPCETGRLGRGAGGSLLRWPHSGLRVGAATHRGHHAAVAPFWGLRCPRGGWVRGGGLCDKDVWDEGPGPWVPPRGGVGVMPRGPAAGDCPGCQQTAPGPAGRVWDSCGPVTEHRGGEGAVWNRGRLLSGLEPEVKVLGAHSSRGFWGQSVPCHSQPQLCLCHHIAFSPMWLCPNSPHEDPPTHRSVTLFQPGHFCGDPSAHKVPF